MAPQEQQQHEHGHPRVEEVLRLRPHLAPVRERRDERLLVLVTVEVVERHLNEPR